VAGRTIRSLWERSSTRDPNRVAYLVERDGAWQEVSVAEAARRVDDLAAGLLAAGVGKGDAVGVLARTTLEWVLLDFALATIGAIGVGVYPSSSARDAAYLLEHSDAVGVFVEDEEQRAKVASERDRLPGLRHVWSFEQLPELEERGRSYAAAHPDALAVAAAAVDEEDVFTFIYTSGTTGAPKGCVIRHRNFYEMVATIDSLPGFIVTGDVMLLYLPLAHNFGRCMHLAATYVGFTLAFCPDPLAVADAMAAVRPTILPSVPRVYEKVHAAVQARFDEATGPRRRLIDWALAVGREATAVRAAGGRLHGSLALRHRLADRLVYSKVKERLGGRLRVGISGGAPLAPAIAAFFHALNVPLFEGYGLTECTTACTVNRADRFRFGTVGTVLPNFELAIAADGEILVRSATVFAGYFKDEEATRAVLGEDGWLHTGDIGELDADGFLRITDRKKDILVTAGGKNLAPQNLENELTQSRYVSQALVVGDRRPYVTALITLDEDELAKWRGAGGSDVEQLVQGLVDEVNRERSRFEQIKRFAILPREFSAEEEEVTPTLKLRRRAIEANFADEIERLYTAPADGAPASAS
jgi:long-chain acyl-CoA synthetase